MTEPADAPGPDPDPDPTSVSVPPPDPAAALDPVPGPVTSFGPAPAPDPATSPAFDPATSPAFDPATSPAPDPALFRPNPGHADGNPAGIGFRALVAEDYRTHGRDPLSQGFWAVFWHRFGNRRMAVRPRLLRAPLTVLYRIMAKACEWGGGIMLPYTVRLGRRVRLDHFGGMILVAQSIGDDVILRQNTTLGIAGLHDLTARPVIGNGVEVGAGAVILGSIHVGDGAIVGANAVVTRSVPARAVVGGVPARVLRMRDAPASRPASGTAPRA